MHVTTSGCRRITVLVGTVLALAGCGGAEPAAEPASSTEPDTGTVAAVTEAITDSSAGDGEDSGRRRRSLDEGETAPGTVLSLGEPAVVAVDAGGRRGVVSATVTDISRGSPADLEGFGIDDRVAGQVPYYVRISLENAGDTEMPYAPLDTDFHGLLEDGSPAGEIGRLDGFDLCESQPAPDDFSESRAFDTCRIFMASEGTAVTGVSYEELQTPYEDDPIVWDG